MTTSARQEPTRAAGAGSSVRYSGPEGTSSIELWLRRIIARLVDIVPVAVLFAGLWISGSDVLSTKPDACDPAPAPSCNVAAQTDRVDEAGNIIIEYTMLDDRVIDSGHATFQVLDTVYIADPPKPSTYLVTLIYVLVVFVVLQGVTGWTPGKLVAGLRLADDERRAPGIVSGFVRWALPDGALGIVGVVMAVVGGPWPLRLLSVFAALGLLRFIGSLVPVLGPVSDERLGLRFVAAADYVGGRPERDDEYDLREQADAQRPPMQPAPPALRGASPGDTPAGDSSTPTGAPASAAGPVTQAGRPATPAPAGGAAPAARSDRGDTPTLPVVGTPGVGRPSGAPPVFPGVPDAGSEAARQQPAPKLSAVPDLPPVLPSVFERGGGAAPADEAAAKTADATTPPDRDAATGRDQAGSGAPTSGFSRPLSAAGAAPTLGAIPGGQTPGAGGPAAGTGSTAGTGDEPAAATTAAEAPTPSATEPAATTAATADEETKAEPDTDTDAAAAAPTLMGSAPLGPDVAAFPAPPLATTTAPQPAATEPAAEAPPAAATETAEAAATTETAATRPADFTDEVTDGADDEAAAPAGEPSTGEPGDAGQAATATATDAEPAPTGTAGAPATTTTTAAANPYPPQWDAARQAYICWEPVSAQWLQWDDAAKAWGPISQ